MAAALISCWLAVVVSAGYLVDRAGFGLSLLAPPMIATAAIVGLALAHRLARRSLGEGGRVERAAGDLLAWSGVCIFVALALLRVAWPALLPPGRGPDLTHHLLLVDYIEQHGHLVHDRALDGSMGEMAHYTPGAHLLAVLIGKWLGTDGVRVFFPLLAVLTALTAGYVFLIARRQLLPLPFAIAAVALLFLPAQYFHGAFTHDSFLAQAVATFFAVASWWALVAWDQERSLVLAAITSVLSVAVFLTWPVFVGPLVVVFVALSASARTSADRARVVHMVVGLAPLLVIAAIHLVGRLGWLAIVRASAAVLEPGVASLGWLLPLLALMGVIVGVRDRNARVTLILLVVIALQAMTFFVLATTRGASTPYMVFKMVYLGIYPMAVFGAVAMTGARRVPVNLGWILAAVLVVVAVRPALTAPRSLPVVELDLYRAGKWVRANVGRTCVDYLVADAETAYWLHLAVLANPRSSARMEEIDRYDPRAAMGPWISSEGRSHAIADLRLLPDEVRSRVEIVETFATAAVIRRPGASTCYNEGL